MSAVILHPRANSKNCLITKANQGSAVVAKIVLVIRPAGTTWTGQHERVASILRLAATHKGLRDVEIIMNRGYPSCSLALANSICQAFITNPFVPSEKKNIEFSIVFNGRQLEEICSLLQAVAPGVTNLKLRFKFDGREVPGEEPNAEQLKQRKIALVAMEAARRKLAKSISCMECLQSLNLDGLSLDVCSSIFQHLSSGEARIRSLHISRVHSLPHKALGSFLSTDAASSLEDLSLGLKDATAEDSQSVVKGLSHINSLTKLELLAYDEILEIETAEILSNYLANQSQLKHLHLRLKTGLQEDRNVKAARALLSGLATNTSITELRIEWHAATSISGFREAMKSFYRQCRAPSLIVDMAPSVDQVQLLVEGLPQNPFIRSLEASCGLESDQQLFKPLAVMLTAGQSQGQSVRPIALETLKLQLTMLQEDPDPSHLFDLVRRPISTLKSMELKLYVDIEKDIAPLLLQVLTESKGLDSFDLFVLGVDADKWCMHLQAYLPQLNSIPSLAINSPNMHCLPMDSKTKLYQSALLNTGLTALSLEPVFSEGLQYKKSLQAICLRNKVHKILAGLQNKSTPLEELPAILKLVQRECQELEVNPERYNAELINAGLRFCAEPETFRAMGMSLARR